MKKILANNFIRIQSLVRRWPEWFLLLLLMLLYTPYLDEPVLRTTGDEKVYVAQALEMAERGSWFKQTLADEANYYKPPLHYIFLRIGFYVFGLHSLWAVLWMNLAAMAVAIFYLVRTLRRLPLASSTAGLTGLGLLLAPGIFAHMFASQMEIELLAVYALVLSCSLQLRYEHQSRMRWTILWILIGLASWIKSPVHSVLLALGILGLLAVHRDLRLRYGTVSGLLAPVLGILTGALSLLIPFALDPGSFLDTYILRETFRKGANGVGVLEALLPNLSYHLWPFMPLLFLGSFAVYHSYRKNLFSIWEYNTVSTSLFLAWPTLIFFSLHPYRSEIYMLPALPALILYAVIGWQKAKMLWPALSRVGHIAWLGTCLIPALLIIVLYGRFHPSRSWWPFGLTETAWFILSIQLALICILWVKRSEPESWTFLLWLPSLFLAAALMQTIGRFDVMDFRQYVRDQKNDETFGFYNVPHFVWSEWGLLNFTGGIPVKGIHSNHDARAWLAAGAPLIVARADNVEQIRQNLEPESQLEVRVWHRWKSHGDHTKKSGPLAAWSESRLGPIQGEYYIVRLQNFQHTATEGL